MKFFLIIIFVFFISVPYVIGDIIYRNIEFTIAHCEGLDAHKVVKYLAFMRTPNSEYQIHYSYAVAEIPANETYFLVSNLPAGDYCFTVVGMLDDGRYSGMATEGCVDYNDFLFGTITLRFGA